MNENDPAKLESLTISPSGELEINQLALSKALLSYARIKQLPARGLQLFQKRGRHGLTIQPRSDSVPTQTMSFQHEVVLMLLAAVGGQLFHRCAHSATLRTPVVEQMVEFCSVDVELNQMSDRGSVSSEGRVVC